MRAVGLITEYNPFHNGHLHHLRESLRLAAAEVSVAVMSGHFLQRGEPALADKWTRAEMALAAGVDIVIELPLPWACGSALDFAAGGVRALDGLGGVTALCFGSEAGELEPLRRCAAILRERDGEIAARTAALLRAGVNYPQARAQVMADFLPAEQERAGLSAPNNILGIEYLKALAESGSRIRPLTIARIGAGYNETGIGAGNIASATGIRRRLQNGDDIDTLLPPASYAVLRKAIKQQHLLSSALFFKLLLAQLFSRSGDLSTLWLVENGIENRLLERADCAVDIEDLISAVKSRQFTRTRVQRMLIAILLGLEKTTVAELLTAGPRYLHLLALSNNGRRYLASSRNRRRLPLIQNFSRVYAQLKRCYGTGSPDFQRALQQLELERRATRMFSLLMRQAPEGARSRDFYRNLLRSE